MDKHNVINVMVTMEESVLLAKWYQGDIIYKLKPSGIFGEENGDIDLPDYIKPSDVAAFFKVHGVDGYVALMEYLDTEMRDVLPDYQTPGYRKAKAGIHEWIESLSPYGDVSGVSSTDVKVINQLVWLRTHTSWVDFCIDNTTPNKPWWVTVPVMGKLVNVLLSEELRYRRRIGGVRKECNHLDIFSSSGLDGLCELASDYIGKPLPAF